MNPMLDGGPPNAKKKHLRDISCSTKLILPPSLTSDYEKFMVNRRGRGDDAIQIVHAIIGTVDKDHTYRIALDGIFETNSDESSTTTENPVVITHIPIRPKLVASIDAQWRTSWEENEADKETNNHQYDNILGRSGRLVVADTARLRIPAAPTSHDHLSFYGAELYRLGDTLQFRTPPSPMAVARVYFGRNYVPGYLLQPDLGGGAYIECHNQPHLHVPLNADAKGHLILAKKVTGSSFAMSAFRIPFGYAVYTQSNALHCDAFLIGEYLAVFAVEDDYRTGILVDGNSEILPVEVA